MDRFRNMQKPGHWGSDLLGAGRQTRQHQIESFRIIMEKEELESKISFQEDILGPDSWLPTPASWHSADLAINVRVLNAFWP